MRVVFGDAAEGLVGDHAARTGRDRLDGMVHCLHQKAVEVDKVTKHVNGPDLAPPVPEKAVARGKARDEKSTLAWAIALPHDVLTLCHCSLAYDSRFKRLSFRV